MSATWMPFRHAVEVRCDVDIEQTAESFHAHAVPDGIDIRPGDVVVVHDVPSDIGFGEHVTCRCRATVLRAGLLARWWTRMTAIFELTELYEVGFAPREAP
jgi:hypothetical protein